MHQLKLGHFPNERPSDSENETLACANTNATKVQKTKDEQVNMLQSLQSLSGPIVALGYLLFVGEPLCDCSLWSFRRRSSARTWCHTGTIRQQWIERPNTAVGQIPC